MNINVVNHIYNSGIAVNYQAVQLPNIPLINNGTFVCASGSTGPIYLGNANVTWQNGLPLYQTGGISLAIDNLNLIYAVMESGAVGDLRWVAN